jgi:hypothetical protein
MKNALMDPSVTIDGFSMAMLIKVIGNVISLLLYRFNYYWNTPFPKEITQDIAAKNITLGYCCKKLP